MKLYSFLFIGIFPLLSDPSFGNYLDVAEELNGTSSHIDGPNCWNGALVAAGVLKKKRFILPEEWLYHLKKSCYEIKVPVPGAVGRLYHPQDGEVHGFIHLNHETIFAKHGEDSQHGYEIMSYEEMLNQYGRTRVCRTQNDESPECFHKVRYYDCHKKTTYNLALKRVARLAEELLFSEETKWFYKVNCQDQAFLKRQEVLDQISNELLEITKKMTSNAFKTNFINNGLHESFLKGLSHQLYNVQVTLRSFRCDDRKKRDAAIKRAKKTTTSLLSFFK